MIINFLFFQLGWFACVVGAANNLYLLGPIVVFFVVFFYLARSINPVKELFFVLIVSLIGLLWENFIIILEVLEYRSNNIVIGFAPLWIVAMWASFSTTIKISLSWLNRKIYLLFIFGFFGGPLSFYAGESLGGVIFLDRALGYTLLAVGWSIMFPLLFYISNKLDILYPDKAK
ncbi:MAG: hypothetical protein CBC38_00175 [Gammaproteobacteria bacterium TMED78]|nr:MAG: hypothetical protein CBC38_00175 [Gammaproteobacteria bacterium TMED78]